jgi:DNA-binding response OmpR family regulator
MAPYRVLVVDDEPMVTEVVERYLVSDGFEVVTAGDGDRALSVARTWTPDLVVLDLMLPSKDGLEVCRTLRKENDVPIIMLTARGEETDRIVGLEIGADDYMVKPFSPRELLARIKAVLRRASGEARDRGFGDVLRFPGLFISKRTRLF